MAFYLWGEGDQPASSSIPSSKATVLKGRMSMIREGNRIGTIKRLLIEKVSGRVLYVDVTFGGFLGIGVHHHTIRGRSLPMTRSELVIARTLRKRRSETHQLSTVMTKCGLTVNVRMS
jgi:hypothetical protein